MFFFSSAESGVIVDMEHFHTFPLELHASSRAAGLSHISGSPGGRIISPLFALHARSQNPGVGVASAKGQRCPEYFFFSHKKVKDGIFTNLIFFLSAFCILILLHNAELWKRLQLADLLPLTHRNKWIGRKKQTKPPPRPQSSPPCGTFSGLDAPVVQIKISFVSVLVKLLLERGILKVSLCYNYLLKSSHCS